jgi:hypothetical protein
MARSSGYLRGVQQDAGEVLYQCRLLVGRRCGARRRLRRQPERHRLATPLPEAHVGPAGERNVLAVPLFLVHARTERAGEPVHHRQDERRRRGG